MATPTVALHSARAFNKAMSVLFQAGTESNANRSGRSSIRTKKRRMWVSAGAPTGAAPAAMKAGDLILDTTNDEVYVWISSTTYVKISATS